MPQNPITTLNVNDGTKNLLFITASTVVKAQPGGIATVTVLQTGSTVGGLYDALSTASANTSNQISVIPNTVGVTKLNFPCLTGLTVLLGTNQIVSIAYR
jgi:hypothetical protein